MLNDQKILITGSTSGIGKAMAAAMLKAGARVVINSNEPDTGSAALAELEEFGECHFIETDLSSVEACQALVGAAFERLGGLDCLVNNAASDVGGPFRDATVEDFAMTFDVNVRASYFTSQAFARLVGKRNCDACILCTGSTNSMQAERESVLYDTSKGAILMLVRSLAVTLAEDGIRVNGIGPGLVKTRLNDYASSSNPELQELMRSQIPLGRIGEPDDIAGAAVFLASPMARYITGHMLYVDGGIIAQQMVRPRD